MNTDSPVVRPYRSRRNIRRAHLDLRERDKQAGSREAGICLSHDERIRLHLYGMGSHLHLPNVKAAVHCDGQLYNWRVWFCGCYERPRDSILLRPRSRGDECAAVNLAGGQRLASGRRVAQGYGRVIHVGNHVATIPQYVAPCLCSHEHRNSRTSGNGQ